MFAKIIGGLAMLLLVVYIAIIPIPTNSINAVKNWTTTAYEQVVDFVTPDENEQETTTDNNNEEGKEEENNSGGDEWIEPPHLGNDDIIV
ncbi:MAG: hypothetical protein IJZ29_04330 [Clostridia bacterium]|nr:hypothetical protein [Clostridia bacterium]